jgi:hypothetical protein
MRPRGVRVDEGFPSARRRIVRRPTSTRVRSRLILGAIAVAATLGATRAREASVLVVTVGDAKSGAFIADAQVQLPGAKRIERTKWNGEAIFAGVTDKRVRIQVRAIGYAPGDFETPITGDTTAVHFELEKLAPVLDTVRTRATKAERQLAEFETRRAAGLGRFIIDSVLVAEHAKGLQQLLVSHIPGLKVAGPGIKAMEPPLVRPKPGITTRKPVGDGCPVLMYLDGFKFTDPAYDVVDLQTINVDEIAGIEVYNQPNAPVQYKPTAEYCKVILLWTKR